MSGGGTAAINGRETVVVGTPAPLDVTPPALELALSTRAAFADPELLALWVEASLTAEQTWRYDLYFRPVAEVAASDAVSAAGGLTVVVPAASVERLRGARLDVAEGAADQLVILNPNPPSVEDVRSAELARQVTEALEQRVNPGIAVHGGRVELDGVRQAVAYVRLQGGCQGCGLARATLTQHIETALRQAVPELVGVVDMTDHDAGAAPYHPRRS